jgi:hypothetical protein
LHQAIGCRSTGSESCSSGRPQRGDESRATGRAIKEGRTQGLDSREILWASADKPRRGLLPAPTRTGEEFSFVWEIDSEQGQSPPAWAEGAGRMKWPVDSVPCARQRDGPLAVLDQRFIASAFFSTGILLVRMDSARANCWADFLQIYRSPRGPLDGAAGPRRAGGVC